MSCSCLLLEGFNSLITNWWLCSLADTTIVFHKPLVSHSFSLINLNLLSSCRSLCSFYQSFQLLPGLPRQCHHWGNYNVWCQQFGKQHVIVEQFRYHLSPTLQLHFYCFGSCVCRPIQSSSLLPKNEEQYGKEKITHQDKAGSDWEQNSTLAILFGQAPFFFNICTAI